MNWKTLFLVFVSGALLVTAFAPFDFYVMAFIAMAVLFYCWKDSTPRACFWLGLSFGYGLYGVGVSWVYVSLATYGGMPFWMGSIAVLGFAGILAVLIAIAGYVSARFFTQYRLLALPFIWVIFEWLKSWVLTGFPWLDIGYTQTSSWLFGWAPVGGVYLVSFVVAVIAVCLVALTSMTPRHRLFISAAVAVIAGVSYAVDQVRWSQAVGQPVRVGIVQPNTPIELKWQGDFRQQTIAKLASLSEQLKRDENIDLVVWPETALPLYLSQTDALFWQSITPPETVILSGVMDAVNATPEHAEKDYNAAVLNCAGDLQVYRKSHLVPFGEYLPLRFLFNWVLDYLQLPMSDFSSWGGGPQQLSCGENINIGLSICYEDAFAAEYRASVGEATMLVNMSEDAWFGDSFAPHQRRQMAQMRARELARPMVRSANSGPSTFIDERGSVLASSGQFEVATLSHELQPQTGDTWFKRAGNWIIALSFTGLLLIYLLMARRLSR